MGWNDKYKQKTFTTTYLKNYETVPERVKKFKKDFKNSVIRTTILSDIKEIHNYIVFKAEIFVDKKDMSNPDSVGHSYSKAGGVEKMPSKFDKPEDGPKIQSAGDFASWVENCETSAVGRALAFLGYIGQKDIASLEEMNQKDENEAAIEEIIQEEKKVEDKKTVTQQAVLSKAAQVINNYKIKTNESIFTPKSNTEEIKNILKD